MKKKLIYGMVLPLLAVVVVTAVIITNYGSITQSLNVESAISVTGSEDVLDTCYSSGTCLGNPIEITNNGDVDIDVKITGEETSTDPDGDGIVDVRYIGELELTKKIIDYGNEPWDEGTEKVQIEYTIVGNEFSAEVIDNAQSGYILIYYKDSSDRWETVGEGIKIHDIEGNLPNEGDGNAAENDYCSSEEYDTCHGAKIWYVPSEALDGGELDWTQSVAESYFYETALIQYAFDGIITMYPGQTLIVTPEYTLGPVEGTDYSYETQVNPVTA